VGVQPGYQRFIADDHPTLSAVKPAGERCRQPACAGIDPDEDRAQRDVDAGVQLQHEGSGPCEKNSQKDSYHRPGDAILAAEDPASGVRAVHTDRGAGDHQDGRSNGQRGEDRDIGDRGHGHECHRRRNEIDRRLQPPPTTSPRARHRA
jgi:hypothetical protein